jgi:hypothetical protein
MVFKQFTGPMPFMIEVAAILAGAVEDWEVSLWRNKPPVCSNHVLKKFSVWSNPHTVLHLVSQF